MSLFDLQGKAVEGLGRYEHPKAAMLPLLWLVQENQGYISTEAEAWVANLIGVSISHVREVVSFYNMFRMEPCGRRELRVCTSLPCVLRGARDSLEQIRSKLGIGPGETTPGGEVTLTEVECLCACEMAPKPVSLSCSTGNPALSMTTDYLRMEPGKNRATLLSASPPRSGTVGSTETEYDVQFPATQAAPALRLRINRYSLEFTRDAGDGSALVRGTCERFRERPI